MVLCVIHFYGLVSHISIPVITKMEKIELAHHLRTLTFPAFVFYYTPPCNRNFSSLLSCHFQHINSVMAVRFTGIYIYYIYVCIYVSQYFNLFQKAI